MIKALDHIGIAVSSIESALGIYEALGLCAVDREDVASQKVRTAFLPVGGTRLELLEPTDPGSPVAKFLSSRGEGIHHLCFRVENLSGTLAELAAKGYELIHREPVPGANGKRVAFLHPRAGRGVLIELSEDAD
jgi:methylmalonyl-CoA epimerase